MGRWVMEAKRRQTIRFRSECVGASSQPIMGQALFGEAGGPETWVWERSEMEESGFGHVLEIRGVKGRLKATAAPALPSFISPIIPSPAACPPQYTTYVPPPLARPLIPAHESHIRSTNIYSPQARRLRANRTRAPWSLASTTRSKPSARSSIAFRGKCTRFGHSEMSSNQRVRSLFAS